MSKMSEADLAAYDEVIFETILAFVLAEERMPDNLAINARAATPFPYPPNMTYTTASIARLAETKRIRVMIYAGNWRAIQIVGGEHHGKLSAKPSPGASPWKIIHGIREQAPKRNRPQPSLRSFEK